MKEIFSQRLKAARDMRKMKQQDLAAKSGLQRCAISRFESRCAKGRGSPSVDNLQRLADALSVTTDYLLGRSNAPGLSGPGAGSLFQHAEILSANDLDILGSMAKVMAEKKNRPARQRSGPDPRQQKSGAAPNQATNL